MTEIAKIGTKGYRGPVTAGQFLPPGEYTVGAVVDIGKGQVSRQAAEYIVGIEKAWIIEYAPVIVADPGIAELPGELNVYNEMLPTMPPRAELEKMTMPELRETAVMFDISVPANIKKVNFVELLAVD